jgi:hypothetical protein
MLALAIISIILLVINGIAIVGKVADEVSSLGEFVIMLILTLPMIVVPIVYISLTLSK